MVEAGGGRPPWDTDFHLHPRPNLVARRFGVAQHERWLASAPECSACSRSLAEMTARGDGSRNWRASARAWPSRAFSPEGELVGESPEPECWPLDQSGTQHRLVLAAGPSGDVTETRGGLCPRVWPSRAEHNGRRSGNSNRLLFSSSQTFWRRRRVYSARNRFSAVFVTCVAAPLPLPLALPHEANADPQIRSKLVG